VAGFLTDVNDFLFARNESGIFDLVIEDGQFKTVDSFDTALQMSIYSDKRAADSEVAQPQLRRGWIGDLLLYRDGYQLGSKLWLLQQARSTPSTLSKAIDYIRTALTWLLDDNHAKDLKVVGSWNMINGQRDGVTITVNITYINNQVESLYFKLWQNTGILDGNFSTEPEFYLLTESYTYIDPYTGNSVFVPGGRFLLEGDLEGGSLLLDER
jgi:phage gp46-like protein